MASTIVEGGSWGTDSAQLLGADSIGVVSRDEGTSEDKLSLDGG